MPGSRKLVGTYEPIMPTQLPRGYGSVAILQKSKGNLMTPIPDPHYWFQYTCHVGGLKTINIEDYEDSLAQIHEILQKYRTTHYIIVGVLGGNFNEDISCQNSSRIA